MEIPNPITHLKTKKDARVAVIILNHNGGDFLTETLSKAFYLNYPNFEIILVDDNSTDESLEKAKRHFPKITFLQNTQRLGFSAGVNVGLKYSLERGAKYIFLLSPGILVKPDTLQILLEKMESDSRVSLVSPMILNASSGDTFFSGGKINWLKMETEPLVEKISADYYASDYLSGHALLIRKDVFRKIGLFDEDYFLSWADVDFCLSARKKGFKLLLSPENKVSFLEKNTENKNNQLYWRMISKLFFFKKNSPLFLRGWLWLYNFLQERKNKIAERSNPTPLSRTIAKAYADFRQAE